MERFAIKIDKKLKANLYKICRLCGMDYPEMVPILPEDGDQAAKDDQDVDVDGELEMSQKINVLIGLLITKDDRMPQTMCSLCVDKINDFYEFREMCYATNAQTRKLLGLKNIKKPVIETKPKVEVKEEVPVIPGVQNKLLNRKRKADLESYVPPKKETAVTAAAVSNKKLRLASLPLKDAATKKAKLKGKDIKYREDAKNREDEDMDVAVKEEIKEEIKDEPLPSPHSIPATVLSTLPPVAKLKQGCTICTERYSTKGKLEAHIRSQHIPKVERYVCSACNETISKSFDIKNHQLWHKLSKTPYVCGLCGDSIISTYAYARHLHEHCAETPPALMVLDRECPQCHVSYATNFLYNTHPCAVKTRRCAGCNRLQRSEAEYVKHSALCAKVYLNYSKHIAPAVEAQEDAVRIKNENDVEAAAEEMARITGLPLDMSPVVHLTRLSSPLIMAASQCVSTPGIDDSPTTTGSKKSSKKGVSKKDLKRVDELLKSTLDALVSIKHEPEVHVEPEAPSVDGETSDNEAIDQEHVFHEDYHHNEESDLDDHISEHIKSVKIKLEVDDILESTNIECSDNVNKTSGGGLKLKIRKEHGQLNSSIIEQQSVDKRAEKRKKKKKHKDKEKERQQRGHKEHQEEPNSLDSFNTQHNDDNVSIDASTRIQIKMEPLEAMETEEPSATIAATNRPQPEATIMTSIPMMQLQIACISEGVEFNGANTSTDATVRDEQTIIVTNNHVGDQEDVKPNREELDRLLRISNVSSCSEMETVVKISQVQSGISMEPDERETVAQVDYEQQADEDVENVQTDETSALNRTEEHNEKTPKLNKIKSKQNIVYRPTAKSRNKACKSTAKPSVTQPVLEISAIQSGVTLPPTEPEQSDFIPIFIKPEPQNRGYSDEPPLPSTSTSPASSSPSQNEGDKNRPTSQFNVEEQAYISSIDFNNITVKQEKDLDIDDVQISFKKCRSNNDSINGIKKRKVHASKIFDDHVGQDVNMENEIQEDDMGEEEEESDQEEEEEDEQEEDEYEEEEDEEEREYRELEYPPELIGNQQAEQMDKTEEIETETDTLQKAIDDRPTNTLGMNNTDNSAPAKEESKFDIRENKSPVSEGLGFVISSVCSHASDLTPLSTGKHNRESDQPPQQRIGSINKFDSLSGLKDQEVDGQFKLSNLEQGENIDLPNVKKMSQLSRLNTPVSHPSSVSLTHKESLHEPLRPQHTQFANDLQVPVLQVASGASDSIEFSQMLLGNKALPHVVPTSERSIDQSQLEAAVDQQENILNTLSEQVVRESETMAKHNQFGTTTTSLKAKTLQCDTVHGLGATINEINQFTSVGQAQSSLLSEAPIANFEKSTFTEDKARRTTIEPYIVSCGSGVITDTNTVNSRLILNKMGKETDMMRYCQELHSTEENCIPLQSVTAGSGLVVEKEQRESVSKMNVEQDSCERISTQFDSSTQAHSEILAQGFADNNYLKETRTTENLLHQHQSGKTPKLYLNPSATIEGIVKQTADTKSQAQPIIESHEIVDHAENEDDEYGEAAENELTEESEEAGEDGVEAEDEEVGSEDHSNLNLEEQQNRQNQEQQYSPEITRPTALALHPYLEDISSSSNSFLSNTLSQTPPPYQSTSRGPGPESSASRHSSDMSCSSHQQQNNEETENILNESNDMISRRRRRPLLSPALAPFNFDNINEIAENNNNANIEREQLQDDQQHQQQRQQHQHYHQETSDDVT